LAEEQERTRQLQVIAQEKIKKDVEMVKKQLHHERNLKRDAFQRVEELQTEVVMRLSRFAGLFVCLLAGLVEQVQAPVFKPTVPS